MFVYFWTVMSFSLFHQSPFWWWRRIWNWNEQTIKQFDAFIKSYRVCVCWKYQEVNREKHFSVANMMMMMTMNLRSWSISEWERERRKWRHEKQVNENVLYGYDLTQITWGIIASTEESRGQERHSHNSNVFKLAKLSELVIPTCV